MQYFLIRIFFHLILLNLILNLSSLYSGLSMGKQCFPALALTQHSIAILIFCYYYLFILTNRNRITYCSDEVLLPRNIEVTTASCFSPSSKQSEEFLKFSTKWTTTVDSKGIFYRAEAQCWVNVVWWVSYSSLADPFNEQLMKEVWVIAFYLLVTIAWKSMHRSVTDVQLVCGNDFITLW